MDINEEYGKFRAHNLRKLFSTTYRENITNVVVNRNKFTELDVVNILNGRITLNMSNYEVYDTVGSEYSFDVYLKKIMKH